VNGERLSRTEISHVRQAQDTAVYRRCLNYSLFNSFDSPIVNLGYGEESCGAKRWLHDTSNRAKHKWRALAAQISVIFAPGEFTDAEKNAIEQGIRSWQNTNGPTGNGSGVTFSFTTGANPNGQTNTQYIHRGTAFFQGGAQTAISFTGSPSTSGNITTSASTLFDTSQHDPTALTNLAAHEEGHPFGLGDCYPECNGKSVMGVATLSGPTDCDNAKAKQNGYSTPTPTPTPSPEPTPDATTAV
jgi:hypothetical protein